MTQQMLMAEDNQVLSETIWVTDAELIRRSGVPEKIMRQNLRALDANPFSGFPKKDPAWGSRARSRARRT